MKEPGILLGRGGLCPGAGRVRVRGDTLEFRTPLYVMEFRSRGRIRLTAGGRDLLDGKLGFQVFSDVHSIIGGGSATTILTPFRPSGFSVLEESQGRMHEWDKKDNRPGGPAGVESLLHAAISWSEVIFPDATKP